MRNVFIHVMASFAILFRRRFLLIEVSKSKRHKTDRVSLWGTIEEREQQVYLLQELKKSIEADIEKEKNSKLTSKLN